MTSISCIITDDEPFARKGLEGYVAKAGFFDLKAQCEDAMELGMVLSQQPVDLLFLDIQMPHLTGVDFIKSLANPPKVIFTTAFKEYATDGFDLDVLDYLLKPISFERFMKAAFKAKDYFDLRSSNNDTNYLFVKSDGKLEKVVFDEVLYIEGMENYIVIHTANKKIITHSTLKAFADKLPQRRFLQTHKSYIIAQDKITSIEGNMLNVGQHQVPVSRQLRDQVMRTLINER
ncbi:LytTR family DNA-binding domain-containing protein [Mucilaginibacter sabulilitoris]|uniref:LytTR family DNA-binding domain-containing protein n=1 Tax=Mucilaginibacter sabulilitoris TaxID=1173583 RepID=A0ABZ0TDX5_9SPHI|nr:LytTR family DNA-binding domain-containing protein [Mucilaginibacter sabulilitoris]WPU90991.1 LytTR family DNA-binding domain-containing protein [Mucilaginibacter sabulilitoris]